MKPLQPSTLEAMGRAEALLSMSDLVECWPNPSLDFPFDTLGPAERLVALGAFRQECTRLTKRIDGLTSNMAESYLMCLRDEWLKPTMLSQWVGANLLTSMLGAFDGVPGQGEATRRAWAKAVDSNNRQRESLAALRMVALLPEGEAEALLRKFWFDQDLGVAHVLSQATRMGADTDPRAVAGIMMDNPNTQKDLCTVWARVAREEACFRQKDGRATSIRLDLLQSAGRLLHFCHEPMEQAMSESGIPLDWLGDMPSDGDDMFIDSALNKIKSIKLLGVSGRKSQEARLARKI